METGDDHLECPAIDNIVVGSKAGDSSKEGGIAMEKLKAGAAVTRDALGISHFFWVPEEEDVESAPRDMKLKWKRLLQKGSAPIAVVPEVEVVPGEDGSSSNWSDLPMELLVRVMALVDNRTVVVASGVCSSWRDALRQGILDLSFSSWCGRNVSNLVQSLAPKFSKLQSCNLHRCPFLSDGAIEAIGSNMPDLKILELTNGTKLTDRSLVALAKGCTHLEILSLSACSAITEVGLVALAESCTNLRQLNLCGCDNAASDKALMALGENCSALRYLNVGWCDRITDVGVTVLARGCLELQVIDLCGCQLITDRSVMALAEHCLCLRVLNLYNCHNLTDRSMYALANKCNLSRGAGRGSTRCSNSGQMYTNRIAVARSSSGSCSTSKNSSSSSCDSVSSQQSSVGYIETLVNNLKFHGLEKLNVSCCRALSAAAVQAVCNAYPDLHTCPERCSLYISGCLNLTSVHCTCYMGRERVSGASQYRNHAPLDPRNLPL